MRSEARIYTATGQWFAPVLAAFNAAHPSLRARFGAGVVPANTDTGLESNAGLSVVVGSTQPGQDLTVAWREANMDAGVLLPGALAASTSVDGKLLGLPVDVAPYVVSYSPYRLEKLHMAAPHPSWTAADFLNLCSQAAHHSGDFGFGLDRHYLCNLTWLGFVQDNGGQVVADGRLSLTTPAVLRGLNAFADVLAVTWNTPFGPVWVGVFAYNATSGSHATDGPGMSLVRFPRMPFPTVPATLLTTMVPGAAPQPAAGLVFTLWLLSRAGQKALMQIGFPAMRNDMGGAQPWFSKGPAGVSASDLRFPPPELSVLAPVQFNSRLYGILTGPPAARQTSLRFLEQVSNGVLAGATSTGGAAARLNAAGVTVPSTVP